MKRVKFNPEIFLEISKKLRDNTALDEIGRFRTSINRAYYAAFLIVRTRLELKGKSFKKEAQHKEVRDYLKDLNHDFLATELETLFSYRVDADYILKTEINKAICDKCILLSETVIESVEEI